MNKNFKLMIIGNSTSSIAATLYNFCTSLFILDITNSVILMSVFLAYSIGLGVVIQPLAGVFAERHRKIKIMYTTDYIFALTDFLLFLVLCFELNKSIILLFLYLNATINTLMSALFQPASASIIPKLVDSEKLQKAYSLFSIVGNFTNIFGIICASLLYSIFGYKWIIFINSLLVFTSACSELFIKIDEKILINTSYRNHYWEDFLSGVKYLRTKKTLVLLLVYAVFINMFITGLFSTTFPYLYNTELNLSPIFLGIIQVSISIGGILTAIYISKREIVNKLDTIVRCFFCIALVIIIYTIIYYCYVIGKINFLILESIFALLSIGIGSLAVVAQVCINTIYTIKTDESFLSRVSSIRLAVTTISAPISMMIYGLLLNKHTVNTVFLFSAIGFMLIVIALKCAYDKLED